MYSFDDVSHVVENKTPIIKITDITDMIIIDFFTQTTPFGISVFFIPIFSLRRLYLLDKFFLL